MTGLARHVEPITNFSSYAEYMEHTNSGNSRVDFTWNLMALKTRLQLLGIKKPTAEDWEKAFQHLVNDINNGVAVRAVPIKLEPYSHQRQRQTLETATDLKQYKEENQIALF